MSRTILITGAAGFVGHHMVEHILKTTEDKIIGVDCLNYSGTWDRLRDIELEDGKTAYSTGRFESVTYDFRQPAEPNFIKELEEVTHILHMGAESHVDHSIEDPLKFVHSNVTGCVNMLNIARQLPELELFVYFSTDEVFGPAPMKSQHEYGYIKGFAEMDVHNPKNPYAASKSAAEQMVTSFANTYGLPCIITRQMNIFGERQHGEKFIPLCIKAALNGDTVGIHATPDKTQAGMRHYIHARNVAAAHMKLLEDKPWEKDEKNFPRDVAAYHIVGEIEIDNLTLAQKIDKFVRELAPEDYEGGKFEMINFHESRPGHDLRYALDGGKMEELGWTPPKTFDESLKKTIEWTLKNKQWLFI